MANMLIFQYGLFGKEELDIYPLTRLDLAVNTGIKILFEGSFLPIFMFIFGFSMIKMKDRLEMKGVKVKRNFVRRFLLLMVLGSLHGTFLWEGDILLSYGFMGFLILLFMNRKKKTLLIWGFVLLFITSLINYGNFDMSDTDSQLMKEYVQKEKTVYQNGTYGDILDFRLNAELPFDLPDAAFLFIFLLIPLVMYSLFLFGMYAAKSNWFSNLSDSKDKFLKYSALLIPTGCFMKSMPYLYPDFAWSGVIASLGASVLAFGYIAAIARLYSIGFQPSLMKMFESVGKLSLSNYLLQTVVCTTIFYGYGLGLFGKLGMMTSVFLAVFIYSSQMLLSTWYLKKYKAGPVEKLLRIGTNLSWSGKVKIPVTQNTDRHV